MVMSWIWTGFLLISLVFAWFTGQAAALAAAVMQGAQSGIQLAVSMAGSLCLWSGLGNCRSGLQTDGNRPADPRGSYSS